MEAVSAQVPLTESYVSAVRKYSVPLVPPVTKNVPSGNCVADATARGVFMLPVTFHVPFSGKYSSAVARGTNPAPAPPAMITTPLGRRVATWTHRGPRNDPVSVIVSQGVGDTVGSVVGGSEGFSVGMALGASDGRNLRIGALATVCQVTPLIGIKLAKV